MNNFISLKSCVTFCFICIHGLRPGIFPWELVVHQIKCFQNAFTKSLTLVTKGFSRWRRRFSIIPISIGWATNKNNSVLPELNIPDPNKAHLTFGAMLYGSVLNLANHTGGFKEAEKLLSSPFPHRPNSNFYRVFRKMCQYYKLLSPWIWRLITSHVR